MFALEIDMIPIIQSELHRILGFPKIVATACELPVNSRVVDLVGAGLDQGQLDVTDAVSRALPKLSMMQLDVLSLFAERDPASIYYLSKRTFMDSDTLHRGFLDYFLRLGLIERRSKYSYETTGWLKALPSCIVAIEAKLQRWQEALVQAQQNLTFADASFVALDIAQVPTSKSYLQEFKNTGIGILGVRDTGTVEVLVPSQIQPGGRDRGFQAVRMLRDLHMSGKKSKWKLVH